MKFGRSLIVSIFTWILWTFVKTIPTQKGLAKHAEKDYTAKDLSRMVKDGAESSVNPQNQKYKETLKPKLKITKKDLNKKGKKVSNRSEYYKEYYQKNKERLIEKGRNYRKQNKEKIAEQKRNYIKKNKERIQKYKKMYNQNNKEKHKEYQRKYLQKKKNVQSNNNEGTSFVNPQTGDFTNLVKLANVSEEEENHLNQEEEEFYNGEDDQNQIEVEEPNIILRNNINQIDLNKKNNHFDLNEMPEDEEIGDY